MATSSRSRGYHPTLGQVNVKQVFWPSQKFGTQCHFFHWQFGSSGPGPCTKWLNTKTKNHRPSKRKKKNSIWHPKVGGWRSAYPVRARLQLAKLANRPSMRSKFGTPVILTNFTNFAKHIFLQRFSKKIGNCQNHKQVRKCQMPKCQKCNISLVGGCNFYGRSQMVPLTIPKVILGVILLSKWLKMAIKVAKKA